MYKLNNKIIRMDQDLVIGEGDDAVVIPVANLSNPSFRAQYGIVEAIEQTRPDDQWFYVTERSDGRFEAILKPRDFLEAQVWESIKIKREAIKLGGFKVGKNWFHSDETSVRKYGYLYSWASNLKTNPKTFAGEPIRWKTLSGETVELTKKLALEIFEAAIQFDLKVHDVAEKHREAMQKEELPFNYDFSQGWPEIYNPAA